MNKLQRKFRPMMFAALVVFTSLAIAPHTSVVAGTLPTGEVQLGQSFIEPAYNDLDGSLRYLLTPLHPPVHPNDHNVAPIYIIVYPSSSAGVIGTVNCQHQPADNCADHGPAIAGLAKAAVPSVYGGGVWGHDHILSAPPAGPPTGGDFNVLWEPVAVLFLPNAPITHITTLSQLNTAIGLGQVMTIPLPQATFHCSVVPAATYNNGTPVPTAPPVP